MVRANGDGINRVAYGRWGVSAPPHTRAAMGNIRVYPSPASHLNYFFEAAREFRHRRACGGFERQASRDEMCQIARDAAGAQERAAQSLAVFPFRNGAAICSTRPLPGDRLEEHAAHAPGIRGRAQRSSTSDSYVGSVRNCTMAPHSRLLSRSCDSIASARTAPPARGAIRLAGRIISPIWTGFRPRCAMRCKRSVPSRPACGYPS